MSVRGETLWLSAAAAALRETDIYGGGLVEKIVHLCCVFWDFDICHVAQT